MSSLKRNTYLEDDDSGSDDDRSQASDEHEQGRSNIGGRTSKRRRVEHNDGVSIDLGSSDGDEQDALEHVHEGDGPSEDDVDEYTGQIVNLPSSKLPTPKSVAKAEKAARKSGVIYISRVPPFMKPHTLKHFLSPHAPKGIGRVFLTPEDHSSYLSRKKNGGNKKKSFTDGWVEFVSKTEAKAAAEILNGNIIGGKKRGYYHDDIWNIKYLSGFKWSHLTEQISAENAEREARMREEIRKTRQENRAFLQDFERGKMLETMEGKKKARGDTGGGGGGDNKNNLEPAREFKQAKARHPTDRSKSTEDASVQRTLSMIF